MLASISGRDGTDATSASFRWLRTIRRNAFEDSVSMSSLTLAASLGRDTIDVGGQSLRFRRALIATGGRAAIPDIHGLVETGFVTNETVFSLTSLPAPTGRTGAGPIGCELAQAFARSVRK